MLPLGPPCSFLCLQSASCSLALLRCTQSYLWPMPGLASVPDTTLHYGIELRGPSVCGASFLRCRGICLWSRPPLPASTLPLLGGSSGCRSFSESWPLLPTLLPGEQLYCNFRSKVFTRATLTQVPCSAEQPQHCSERGGSSRSQDLNSVPVLLLPNHATSGMSLQLLELWCPYLSVGLEPSYQFRSWLCPFLAV